VSEPIPFVDLEAQYRTVSEELEREVLAVLRGARYILGPAVQAFEREFADYCEVPHAVAVNSGTSALHLSALAAGVGPGDEVVTVPSTFVATVAAITYAGARPVLVDVDPSTLTMDPGRLEEAITPRTKAVIPVHLYGQPADMRPILEIARSHGLTVIEDACQAHGARYRGQRVGGLGDFGCFSFYPAKNLGACGEGGIAVTEDATAAERMRMMRDWGQRRKYEHVVRGFNYRMDGVQGAVLGVKLRHLDEWNAARRAIAARYDTGLAGTPVEPVARADYSEPVYHLYVIRHEARDELQAYLEGHGIQTGRHYPQPVHLLEAYRDLGYAEGDFPVAERAACTGLSLPIYPEMPSAHVDSVIEAVRGFFAG